MTTSSKPEGRHLDLNEKKDQTVNPVDLSGNPDYTQLLELYQRAEFNKCEKLLGKLEKQYPEHPGLLEFKDDLQVKSSFKNIAISNKIGEKRKKKKAIFKMSAFAIIAVLIVASVFFVSYYLLTNIAEEKQLENDTELLTSLGYQAEHLLRTGQPQPAAEIIERMKTINPDFENLVELSTRADNLLRLEADYQTALDLISEKKDDEALVILNDIEAEEPGMWDVSQKIASVEISFQITKHMEEGNAAFLDNNWDQVISAYENALMLDPKLNDPLMTEQLLQGYLNEIISMLENENTSIEEIKNAEEYYRRAVAIAPQSRAFASERGNLQKASSNLLELKFTQLAKANLAEKNQTLASVAEAVAYMRKAVNIKPENTAMSLDLKNAEYYQIAFKNFLEMDWNQAITNLNQISSIDSNYAGGNANLLLFEAYFALGKEYNKVGLYLDAISILEQAEILAWNDSTNLMKLFQVQVLLGDTFGKVNDYKSAVSYYQYALNAIQINKRLTNSPAKAAKLAEVNVLIVYRKYEDAYLAYQEVLKDIDVIYSISEIEIGDGVCLALFASENHSTVDAVLEVNNLPKSMAITFGRKLEVPMIEK